MVALSTGTETGGITKIRSYDVAGGNKLFDVLGFSAQLAPHGLIEAMAQLNLKKLIGNSHNQGRTKFGRELAAELDIKYEYIDVAMLTPDGHDELTRERYLEQVPGGLSTFEGCVVYQYETAMSKANRFLNLPRNQLVGRGLIKKRQRRHAMVLVADSISIMDGKPIEKPYDADEAISQIRSVVDTSAAYYITVASVAMMASGVDGISSSVTALPLRVNPDLSHPERRKLANDWISLYRDPAIPVTPIGASGSNLPIYRNLQAGLLPSLDEHVTPLEHMRDFIARDTLNWTDMGALPDDIRNEVGTILTGASPRGFLMAIAGMVGIE